MQTLKVNQDFQVRITGKTLTLPKHEKIILNSRLDFFALSKSDL